MTFDFNEVRQLLVTISQTDITEVTLKSDEFELTVRKSVNVSNQIVTGSPGALSGVVSSGTPTSSHIVSSSLPEPAPSRAFDNAVLSANAPSGRLVDVLSPMVGTFYRAPAPGEASFVEVGDRVRSGQTVCIIEAMKLMNEIEAEVFGQVMEILVQNGEPVEYGQPLMRINPD